jgi:hypothetical protein
MKRFILSIILTLSLVASAGAQIQVDDGTGHFGDAYKVRARNVTVAAGTGLSATTVQSALAELKTSLNALDYVTPAQLALKLDATKIGTLSVGMVCTSTDGLTISCTETPLMAGTETANTVLSGPASGVDAAPTFRALVALDIPDLSATYEAVDAAIMRTDNVSEIAGLTAEAAPSASDWMMTEDATTGIKAKITLDALVTLITPPTPYEIVKDDTSITITDDGVGAGSIAITVDNTTVMTISADGVSMGPIAATAALASDNTYSSSSLLTGLNAGESINQWATVYFDGTEGEWMNADANAAGKWPARGMAVAAGTNGNALDVITSGFVRFDTWNWVLTGNLDLCLSETAGGVVACSDATLCSAEDDAYQIIGWAVTADIAYFDFSGGAITCAAP